MSVTQRDKVFPLFDDRKTAVLAAKIASCLQKDFGDQRPAVKYIRKLTRIKSRTAKNWYQGRNIPSLKHFLHLSKASPSLIRLMLEEIGGSVLRDAFEEVGEKHRAILIPKQQETQKNEGAKFCTFDVCLPLATARKLNLRQLWVLSSLAEGGVTAQDIVSHWKVSIRTAKYDLAGLKKLNLTANR